MIIKVTQEHIDKGCKLNTLSCPVALAMEEATGDNWSVGSVFFWLESKKKAIPITIKIRYFIEDFDSGKKVLPFEFELNI